MTEPFFDGPNAGMEDPLMQAVMRFDALMTRRIAAPAQAGTEEDVELVRRTFAEYRRKELLELVASLNCRKFCKAELEIKDC
jgi:hypothetical protein